MPRGSRASLGLLITLNVLHEFRDGQCEARGQPFDVDQAGFTVTVFEGSNMSHTEPGSFPKLFLRYSAL